MQSAIKCMGLYWRNCPTIFSSFTESVFYQSVLGFIDRKQSEDNYVQIVCKIGVNFLFSKFAMLMLESSIACFDMMTHDLSPYLTSARVDFTMSHYFQLKSLCDLRIRVPIHLSFWWFTHHQYDFSQL